MDLREPKRERQRVLYPILKLFLSPSKKEIQIKTITIFFSGDKKNQQKQQANEKCKTIRTIITDSNSKIKGQQTFLQEDMKLNSRILDTTTEASKIG